MKAGAVHSRVCKFMSASFVTTGFGRSGNTDYSIGVSGQRPRGSGRAVMDWTLLGGWIDRKQDLSFKSPTMKNCTFGACPLLIMKLKS